MRNCSRRGCSGQIIAVSALVIALIMTSTATYIYELSGNISDADSYVLNDFISSIELGSKHAVISALANITNGGSNQTLIVNLNNWKTVVEQDYSLGKFSLNNALRGTLPYSSGLDVNWDINGNGVSEAYVSFQLNAIGGKTEMQRPYDVNVTTRLHIEGFMMQITPSTKQIMVTCRLFNEGQPALVKNLTVYYKESTQWIIPNAINNYVLSDYGNGTYRTTFNIETTTTSLDVSVRVFDLRSILVQTNATCLQQQY